MSDPQLPDITAIREEMITLNGQITQLIKLAQLNAVVLSTIGSYVSLGASFTEIEEIEAEAIEGLQEIMSTWSTS